MVSPSGTRGAGARRCGQGTVKLSERSRDERVIFREKMSGGGAGFGDRPANCKALLARSAAEVSSDGFGIRDVEEIRDLIVNG